MTVHTSLKAEYYPATTVELNADIEALTACKAIVGAAPLKAVFESVISLLTLVRDETIDDEPLAELVELCVRTCRAFAAMTRERDMNTLSGSSGQWIEDLGRTVRSVEFTVKECANCARDLQRRNCSYTEENLIAWRAALCEILTAFEGSMGCGSAIEHVVGAESEPPLATAAPSDEPFPLTLPPSSFPSPNPDLIS